MPRTKDVIGQISTDADGVSFAELDAGDDTTVIVYWHRPPGGGEQRLIIEVDAPKLPQLKLYTNDLVMFKRDY